MFRIAYLVIYAQFAFIVLLFSALSSEYENNPFMQQWISTNASPVGYLLNGYLAAMLIGVVFGGAILLVREYWQNRTKTIMMENLD
jgi:hypothetical protein